MTKLSYSFDWHSSVRSKQNKFDWLSSVRLPDNKKSKPRMEEDRGAKPFPNLVWKRIEISFDIGILRKEAIKINFP